MSDAGWGGMADLGFSGVPPEMQAEVERHMAEGPDAIAAELPEFSQSQYDRRPFTMRRFLRPYAGGLLGVFLLVASEAILAQAGPLLLQIAIDDGIQAGNRELVVTMGVIFAVAVILAALLGIVRMAVAGRVGSRLMAGLRVDLFTHFQRLSLDFYTKERAGRLLSRMTSDLESLQQLFQQGLVQLTVQAVTLIAISIVLVAMSPLLAMITLFAVVPATLALSLWYRRVSEVAQLAVRDRIADLLVHLQESLAGIRIITALNRRVRTLIEHQNAAGDYLDANDRTAEINSIYGPGAEALGPTSQVILLVVGGRLMLEGSVSMGELVAFLLYVGAFFAPIQEMVGLFNIYQQGRASMKKLADIFATEPSVPESPTASALPTVTGEIQFHDVTFGYDDNVPVVGDVNLTIHPGEVIAIVGPTGAGKSTVAKLLNRFYDPQQGAVSIDGHDIRDVTLESLRRQIGVVPQEPFLFGGSIRENLSVGNRDLGDEEIVAACASVGLDRLLSRLPLGIDSQCHERGVSLSAGERQLLALARAFLSQPRLLVLDEATSSLDLRTEAAVEHALDVVLEGRTAVIIAHRLQTTLRADRIVVIDAGRVVEVGTRRELIDAGGHFADMWAASGTERTPGDYGSLLK